MDLSRKCRPRLSNGIGKGVSAGTKRKQKTTWVNFHNTCDNLEVQGVAGDERSL